LVIGALLIPAFVFVEWKVAKLPMMPSKLRNQNSDNQKANGISQVRLFQSDMSANLVLIQGTLHGVVYWANLYYVPLYLQNVRGYDPIMSGVIILPMVASHGVGSLVSGQIISRTGHYNPTIITSNLIWTIGAALQTIYTRSTPVWAICVIGFLQGVGIGGAFQRKFSIYKEILVGDPFTDVE
jgi:cyanate permease